MKKEKKAKVRSHKVKSHPVTKVKAKRGSIMKHKNFYDLLLKKRDDIINVAKQKEGDLSYNEIGDEADVASQTFEREMMFELTNGERATLDDIEAAIRKVEKGDFGSCESCHKKISQQRIAAMPWARLCIQCQSRAESHI